MSKPNLPWTREQSLVADVLNNTYTGGGLKVIKNPTEEDPTLIVGGEFWGDSYSFYNLEVTINPDGTLK